MCFRRGIFFSIRRGKIQWAAVHHGNPGTDVVRVTVRWRDDSFIPEPKWSQVEKEAAPVGEEMRVEKILKMAKINWGV